MDYQHFYHCFIFYGIKNDKENIVDRYNMTKNRWIKTPIDREGMIKITRIG